jgi:hypothetical protein
VDAQGAGELALKGAEGYSPTTVVPALFFIMGVGQSVYAGFVAFVAAR